MPTDTQKTVAGALLIGASALTGNALLVTVAQGVGGSWTSEGLMGLWSHMGQPPTPRAALIHAGEQSIQQAVETLRRAYQQESGARVDDSAFTLVRECASAVAEAQYPTESLSPVAAQQALATSLDELLYGHEARRFLADRLLDAVAVAFRETLAADEQAWRLFHGWLLEQITSQTATVQQHFTCMPEVLAQLQDQGRAAVALAASAESLRQLRDELHDAIEQLKQAQPAAGATFENTDIEVGADLNQAVEDIYIDVNPPVQPAQSSPGASSATFRNQGVRVKGSVYQSGRNIIKSQLDHATQSVATSATNYVTRQELEQLLQQFSTQLQHAAAQGHAEDAEIAARQTAALVEEVSKAQPDKELVTFSLERLKKAAENIAAVLPIVLPLADQIARHIQALLK